MYRRAMGFSFLLLNCCGSIDGISIDQTEPGPCAVAQTSDAGAGQGGDAGAGDAGGACDAAGQYPAIVAQVSGLRSDQGTVFVALFSSASGFSSNHALRGGTAAIVDRTATLVFHDVPPGTYAVSFFHDENANSTLDTNSFGIPVEGFGFSRDGHGTFGPPDFGQIDFGHAAADAPQDVIMHAVYY